MPTVSFDDAYFNHRADVVHAHEVYRSSQLANPDGWILYLHAHPGVIRQLEILADGACEVTAVPAQRRSKYTQRVVFPLGLPAGTTELLASLSESLTVSAPGQTDFVLALDWYKIPNDGDPMNWPNSAAGQLISTAKYWKASPADQKAAYHELVERLGVLVAGHPILNDLECVVSVPGSNADGRSFGERLARDVAYATDKQLITTTSTHGAREPRKAGGRIDIESAFACDAPIFGGAVVVDDVIRSGQSMGAAGHAARLAGAGIVAGLAAVKTMRS